MFGPFDLRFGVEVSFRCTCVLCGVVVESCSFIYVHANTQVAHPWVPAGWVAVDGVTFCPEHKIELTADGEPLYFTHDTGRPVAHKGSGHPA